LEKIKTVPQLLRNVVQNIHPESDTFLLYRDANGYQPITYKESFERIYSIASWFIAQGIEKGDRVALICDNSPEWVLFDQAIQNIGAVNLSIYPTLPEADVAYILNDSGAKMILCGNPFLFKKILTIYDECPQLNEVITVFDDNQKLQKVKEIQDKVYSFNEIIQTGKGLVAQHKAEIDSRYQSISTDDICTLIYTSGTTGTPKGVMLTHNNLVMNASSALEQIDITSNETFLSFLPLSHVFERTATYMICLMTGSKMAFAESLEALGKNMIEVKPSIMNVVPRLLEKIHDKAIKNPSSLNGL
jgi:long-chain acyl-CoA synthetase